MSPHTLFFPKTKLSSQKGTTSIEYALVATLLSVAAIVGIRLYVASTENMYDVIKVAITGSL